MALHDKQSNYMFHDSVAMKGFGKMFQSFWHDQIENANTLRKYVLKRGGFVETRPYKVDYFFFLLKFTTSINKTFSSFFYL